MVSGSFLAGAVGGEGFFEEEVSDFGGFTPFTVSIPSTVTVFPVVGSFSTFSSFFFPAQEVRVKRKAVKKIKMLAINFLFRLIDASYLPSSCSFRLEEEVKSRDFILVLYYQF